MTDKHTLEAKQKQELQSPEKTVPGRTYAPATDIYETDKALVVVMEIPGVEKNSININLEKNELTVEGLIDYDAYKDYIPVYTEYNIGHFSRSFTLSNIIDKTRIEAKVEDGVLTLTLPKVEEAAPRRIAVH